MKTNENLKHRVLNEIRRDPRLKNVASQIGVFTKGGTVTLTGEVDTFRKKLVAGKAAQRATGVKNVTLQIDVNLSKDDIQTDYEIESALTEALKLNQAVNEENIKVRVEKGWVFLSGAVEWEFHRQTAEEAVLDLEGARGVTNQIRIKSKGFIPNALDKKMSLAFHRSAKIDLSTLHMEVFGSGITLHEKIYTSTERQEAIMHSLPYINQ